MLVVFTTGLLIKITDSLKLSPELSGDIVSSIRSNIMFPASLFTDEPHQSCDSLTSGPFCQLFNTTRPTSSGGILDRSLWGGIPKGLYRDIYSSLSQYVESSWSGSVNQEEHTAKLTRLSSMSSGLLVFYPHALSVDSEFLSLSDDPKTSLLKLNSFYSYIFSYFNDFLFVKVIIIFILLKPIFIII